MWYLKEYFNLSFLSKEKNVSLLYYYSKKEDKYRTPKINISSGASLNHFP